VALLPDGTGLGAGRNAYGQLGIGKKSGSEKPPKKMTTAPAPFVAIAAGGESTCILRPDGFAYCAGDNDYGQLGDGTKTARESFVLVQSLQGAVGIAMANNTTCFLTDAGQVWCVGRGVYGQLGNGQTGGAAESTTPIKVTAPAL
jgi:alpha-tubulin suppressor-like RCC1 family protein